MRTSERQSALVKQQASIPVLTPSMLSPHEGFVGVMKFAATLPTRAGDIVRELEKYERSYRLDATLQKILGMARHTVNRRKPRLH